MKTVKRQKGPGLQAHITKQSALKKSLRPAVTGSLPKISKPAQSHPLPGTRDRLKALRGAVNW